MRITSCVIAICMLCLSFLSCGRGGGASVSDSNSADTLELKYSSLLEITIHKSDSGKYYKAAIKDPWNRNKTLHTYLLLPPGVRIENTIPDATVVNIPLKRVVSATGVHAALLSELNAAHSIAGVCEPQYINLDFVKEGVQEGKIVDCGSGMNPTLEAVMNLEPDALLLSPFQNSGGYGKIEGLGIPVIEVADYMEAGPLARAEWIKFYGLLFGRDEMADSIFNSVEQRYNELKARVAESHHAKKMILNKMDGSAWYVPESRSPMGMILADASVSYPWSGYEGNGSRPLSFEKILSEGGDADLWLFHYNSTAPMTLTALAAENPRYKMLAPYKAGMVYASNMATNRFNERTPFHPDLLLRDILCISHPELGLGEPLFFQKLL